MIDKLLKYHSKAKIKHMIFGVDIDPYMVLCTQKMIGKKLDIDPIKLINIQEADFLIWEPNKNMKFNIILSNPPYKGRELVHQQFFNIAVKLIEKDGHMSFIQPATTYFNKKPKKKDVVIDMLNNLKKYSTSVTMKVSTIFEEAGLLTDLSITYLQKTLSPTEHIQTITYKNGKKYHDVDLEDISFTQLPPHVFHSIKQKYEGLIKINGSVEDRVSHDLTVKKLALPKIRGNGSSHDDFLTLFSNQQKYKDIHVLKQDFDFGIVTDTGTIDEYRNIFDYLESVVARFGLAMIKYNQHTDSGELMLIPWLSDFSRTYTEHELYKMLNLTDIEIEYMESVISDYYNKR